MSKDKREDDAKKRVKKETEQARPMHDQETVDGVFVQIKKTELKIAGGQSGQIQKRHAYEIKIAIPDWDKNCSLLKSVKKGYSAQQKLLTKFQGRVVRKSWMIQRFIEIDKTVAKSLTTVAERISTRRWREKERGEALQHLQDAFHNLQRWTAKATRYCERAEQCPKPAEKETILDAACLSILKVGELVNKVEQMQHGFWEDFSTAHFLEMRRMRNLIGHTSELEGESVIPLGTGICQDLQVALRSTLFPENAVPGEDGFKISASQFRELEPSHPGEKSTPGNSIAMICIDEHSRFVIHRVGRSEANAPLISSSVTGPMKLSIHYR